MVYDREVQLRVIAPWIMDGLGGIRTENLFVTKVRLQIAFFIPSWITKIVVSYVIIFMQELQICWNDWSYMIHSSLISKFPAQARIGLDWKIYWTILFVFIIS